MSDNGRGTGYDALAWFYEKYWGDFHAGIFRAVEELVLKRLAPGAAVLDLCCGTGHLTRLLSASRVKVAGCDLSREMLKYAAAALPDVKFFASDVRALSSKGPFDAIVSTSDSINHLLLPEELDMVFSCVHDALSEGGIFLFDMLLEETYVGDWRQSGFYLEDDNACLLRGSYDTETRLASAEITLFRLLDCWERTDLTVHERYYPAEDFMGALDRCGFTNMRLFDAKKDLRLDGRHMNGRAFISAERGIA